VCAGLSGSSAAGSRQGRSSRFLLLLSLSIHRIGMKLLFAMAERQQQQVAPMPGHTTPFYTIYRMSTLGAYRGNEKRLALAGLFARLLMFVALDILANLRGSGNRKLSGVWALCCLFFDGRPQKVTGNGKPNDTKMRKELR